MFVRSISFKGVDIRIEIPQRSELSQTQTDLKKRFRLVRRKSTKKVRSSLQKYGLISINLVTVLAVALFLVSSRPDKQQVKGQGALVSHESSQKVVSLDQVSAADIAVSVAVAARLPEIDQIRNQADSKESLIGIAASDDVVLAKPQIIATGEAGTQTRKDIINYTVEAGETVQSIAEKFNVSSDSVKGSNGLTGDILPEGRELVIPPKNRSGIVYKVTADDTVDKLAEKYKTSADKITKFNDLELSAALPVGEYIFLPDGEKLPDPVVVAQRSTTSTVGVNTNSYTNFVYVPYYGGSESNGYDYGQCTYWAAKRRIDIGAPLPINLGNAISWDDNARAIGYLVDHEPSVGAVLQDDGRWAGGYFYSIYHVAFVEEVHADGSIVISQMNYPYSGAGVTYQNFSATEAANFNYIH